MRNGVIDLSVGSNVITVEVTAEDDLTTRTYTVTVTRAAPSTDATLRWLALSGIDVGNGVGQPHIYPKAVIIRSQRLPQRLSDDRYGRVYPFFGELSSSGWAA